MLNLRHYTSDDLAFIFRLFAESPAMTFYPEEIIRKHARDWLNEQINSYQQYGYGMWVMEAENKTPVGQCGFMRRLIGDKERLELGFSVLRSHRGKGYATRAVALALQKISSLNGADIVYAVTDNDNAIARRILIKNGFIQDGVTQRHNKTVPVYIFKTVED